MDRCQLVLVALGAMLMVVARGQAQEDLFRCHQPDGSIKFSDHTGPGCEEGTYQADVTRLERGRSVGTLIDQEAVSTQASPLAVPPQSRLLSARPFPFAIRTVPALAVRDLPAELRSRGMSLPNKGEITIVQLAVRHLPLGDGPKVWADSHFRDEAKIALEIATYAAAKALDYDPRYLAVELTLPVGFALLQGIQMDGPSAGVAWTVAIASAILGDPLRSDVCLSGTMGLDLLVGPVSGLEDKLDGCQMLRQFRELVLPVGQATFAVRDKGLAHAMKVTEVATLAEAYQIATGHELRAFR